MPNISLLHYPPLLRGVGSKADGLIWYNSDSSYLHQMANMIKIFLELYPTSSWAIRLLWLQTVAASPIMIKEGVITDRYADIIVPGDTLVGIPSAISMAGATPCEGWPPGAAFSDTLSYNTLPTSTVVKRFNHLVKVLQSGTFSGPLLTISAL